MLRDDQLERICETRCGVAGRKGWRTLEGPSEAAMAVFFEKEQVPLSSSQECLVLAAWAVWNHDGGLSLGRCLKVLSGAQLEELGTLLVALARGADAVAPCLDVKERQQDDEYREHDSGEDHVK